MRGDGGLVAAGGAIAANVPGFKMRGGGNQLVAIPHAGGKTGLVVRSVLAGMRASIHPDGHGCAGFPCADNPCLNLSGDRIGHSPHSEAEWSGGDMPLRLKPADTLRHGNDRLRKTQRFRAPCFVEWQSRPVHRIGTAAALECVLVVNSSPGSG